MAAAQNRTSSFKVVLLGEGCVGKTSLVLRYVEDKFNDKHYSTLQVREPTEQSQWSLAFYYHRSGYWPGGKTDMLLNPSSPWWVNLCIYVKNHHHAITSAVHITIHVYRHSPWVCLYSLPIFSLLFSFFSWCSLWGHFAKTWVLHQTTTYKSISTKLNTPLSHLHGTPFNLTTQHLR